VKSERHFEFEAIGIIRSPFKEKFGIPRQPGLVPGAGGVLELLPPFNRPETVAELDGYSHLWVQFVFHQSLREQWQPTVRPPRLGGNRRVGVFASRAPFRPNPIGLSVVALEKVIAEPGRVELQLSGIDMVDGTPVLDVKPYVPYVDSIPAARSGFADAAPPASLNVRFAERVEQQLRERPEGEELRTLIEQLLALDPRPAYQEQGERVYGFRLYDFDLRWRVIDGCAEVVELNTVVSKK
jgi:tRNA-Thr(GGU) m(6)t(6)A37 methyltransferase TsaA